MNISKIFKNYIVRKSFLGQWLIVETTKVHVLIIFLLFML